MSRNNPQSNKVPGGVPSAHVDTSIKDLLPDPSQLPEFDFTGTPELAKYPDYINAASELLDANVENGFGNRIAISYEQKSWTYKQLLELSNQIARVLV